MQRAPEGRKGIVAASGSSILLPVKIQGFQDSWPHANREVLWGWKRDSGNQQRIILFGTSLSASSRERLLLDNWFFFYRSRSYPQDIFHISKLFRSEAVERDIGHATVRLCARTRLEILELSGGPGLVAQGPIIQRLMNRRPRRRIPTGRFPLPAKLFLKLRDIGPIAAYVGSGLSYESGLPTLASVHETFGVDCLGDNDFTFGARDPIPGKLAESVTGTFARFVRFHLLSAAAVPSVSHERLANLYRSGVVTRILTDNVDNLFSKLDVPFTRTRGIGIFNDKFTIKFDQNEKTLLVIGVAADRRLIIQQARKQGLRVVVVNPEEAVSPRSQSLSYLRHDDTWYRTTAREFFDRHVAD